MLVSPTGRWFGTHISRELPRLRSPHHSSARGSICSTNASARAGRLEPMQIRSAMRRTCALSSALAGVGILSRSPSKPSPKTRDRQTVRHQMSPLEAVEMVTGCVGNPHGYKANGKAGKHNSSFDLSPLSFAMLSYGNSGMGSCLIELFELFTQLLRKVMLDLKGSVTLERALQK